MALGGSSPPPMPAPQPITPVPSQEDNKYQETQRKAAIAAKGRDGYSAHLLSSDSADQAAPTTEKAGMKAGMLG